MTSRRRWLWYTRFSSRLLYCSFLRITTGITLVAWRYRTRLIVPVPQVTEQVPSSSHLVQTQYTGSWHRRGHFVVSSEEPSAHGVPPSSGIRRICLVRFRWPP